MLQPFLNGLIVDRSMCPPWECSQCSVLSQQEAPTQERNLDSGAQLGSLGALILEEVL